MKAKLVPPLAIVGAALLACGFWNVFYDDHLRLLWDGTKYFDMAVELLRPGSAWHGNRPTVRVDTDIAYSYLLATALGLFGSTAWIASALNALLWGFTAVLTYLIGSRFVSGRWSLWIGILVAVSPVMTSYSPKAYPEILAAFLRTCVVWGWVEFIAQPALLRGSRAWMGAVVCCGLGLLAMTKSEYFPLLLLYAGAAAVLRQGKLVIGLVAITCLVLPYHLTMQKGGRGSMAINGQVARVLAWDYSVIGQCATYSLSNGLGRWVFPHADVECDPFGRSEDAKPGDKKYARTIYGERNRLGYGVREALPILISNPLKYGLVSFSNVLGGVWFEGIRSEVTSSWPKTLAAVQWLGLRILYSMLIWLFAVYAIVTLVRQRPLWGVASGLLIPLFYRLALSAYVLGEVRYFYSGIPLLYLLAGLGLYSRYAELPFRFGKDPLH